MLKNISSILYSSYIIGCLNKRKSKGFNIIVNLSHITVVINKKIRVIWVKKRTLNVFFQKIIKNIKTQHRNLKFLLNIQNTLKFWILYSNLGVLGFLTKIRLKAMTFLIKISKKKKFAGPVKILSNFVHFNFNILLLVYDLSKTYKKISSGKSRYFEKNSFRWTVLHQKQTTF